MWIYRDNDLLFKYIVTTRPWPAGQIVGVAVTLRGARRIARRGEWPDLVEVVAPERER